MPKDRIIILTTDKTLLQWRSRGAKLKQILTSLADIEGCNFTIDIEYRDIVPAVKDGRVTHEWYDSISAPLLAQGYDFVAFHMADKQRSKWGIKPALRGSAQSDFDLVGEFWFWADENTRRGRFNQFVQVFLHEFRHVFKRGAKQLDDTHAIHGDAGDIRGAFKGLKMADYSPLNRNLEQQVSILQKVVVLAKEMARRAIKPRPTLYQAAVSYLGRDASPTDIAPDLLGCAESVSMVIRDVLPDFPIITGTWTLNERLKADPRFRVITTPTPGAIIMSPTGTSRSKKVPNGHVGIFGGGEQIMSNDSFKQGKWLQNFTLASWEARYGKAGYPIIIYHLNS